MDDIFRDDDPAPLPKSTMHPSAAASLTGKRGKTKGAKDKPGTKRHRKKALKRKPDPRPAKRSPAQDLSGDSPPRAHPQAGRPGVTAAQWHLLVQLYREQPGQHQLVASRVGISTSQARRLWHHGGHVPGAPESGPPIADLYAATAVQLRSELQFRREAALAGQGEALARLDLVRARADSVRERVEHIEHARAHRGSLVQLVAVYGDLVDNLRASLGPALAQIYDPERMAALIEKSPKAALDLVSRLVKIGKDLGEATEHLVKLERALLGEATERTEHTTVVRFESEQDAIDTIMRAREAAARHLPAGKMIDTTASTR